MNTRQLLVSHSAREGSPADQGAAWIIWMSAKVTFLPQQVVGERDRESVNELREGGREGASCSQG